jgi:hypothetical protein
VATYTNIPSSVTSLNKATYTNIPDTSSTAFSPDSLSGLEMWLKGDAVSGNDGDTITTWTKSGGTSGVSPTQATVGRKPILKKAANGINSLAVLRFDGTDDFMLGTFDAGSTGLTVFIVGRTGSALSSYGTPVGSGGDATSTARTPGIDWAFAYGNSGDTFAAGWAGPNESVHLGTAAAIATNQVFYSRYKTDKVAWSIDGPNSTTPADTSFPTGTFEMHLACASTLSGTGACNFPFNGDLAEIIVYSRALTAGETTQVKTYLQGRWAF